MGGMGGEDMPCPGWSKHGVGLWRSLAGDFRFCSSPMKIPGVSRAPGLGAPGE